MKKSLVIALAGAAALLTTGAAQAGGHVNWSIGINLPPVATVISNGPAYGVAYGPVYAPAYPVYAPAPVVYPVGYPGAYYARPVYGHRHYRPAPVVYGPPPGHWRQDRGWAPVPRDERRHRH